MMNEVVIATYLGEILINQQEKKILALKTTINYRETSLRRIKTYETEGRDEIQQTFLVGGRFGVVAEEN